MLRRLSRYTPFTFLLTTLLLIGVAVLMVPQQAIATTYGTNFESFTLGQVHGQDGWTSGHGSSFCPLYDVAVVSNTYGYPSFGTKSLRISNAITCGSFNDQTFSKSLTDEAGETSADTSVYSGGTRQPYFEASWDFASTVPGSEQPGLSVVASADRGDPGRMSWLQMQDTPSGLQLNFEDYDHSLLNFVLTPIATGLDRTVPHTVKITIHFIDGASNDVVKVYLDGELIHTGTSWEDYFRDFEVGVPHPVDSILFRVAGTAAPANSGKGFLIDNFSSFSGPVPVPGRGEELNVLTSLGALLPTGDDKTDDQIEKAIVFLSKSLDPALWVDDSHLTKKGGKVFDEEKNAVDKLMKIDNPPTAVSNAINSLLAVDQALAQTAINDAIAANGNSKDIVKAQDEMAKAAQQITEGHLANAIDRYRKAWQHASKADEPE